MSSEFFSDHILDFLSNENDEVVEATVDALIADIPDSVLELGGTDAVVPNGESVPPQVDKRPATASSEFKRVTTVEIEHLIAKNDNENTKCSTNTWVKCYNLWATERGMPTDLAHILPTDQDTILQQIYSELRKRNGKDYEPESLKVMQTALDRHLRDAGSVTAFTEFQKTVNGKAVDLQEQGKGKRPDPLTGEDEAYCTLELRGSWQ